MTDRQHTQQIVVVLCHAANNAPSWLSALGKDKAFAKAYRAYELDPMLNSAREALIIEFTRVFAGVLEVQ